MLSSPEEVGERSWQVPKEMSLWSILLRKRTILLRRMWARRRVDPSTAMSVRSPRSGSAGSRREEDRAGDEITASANQGSGRGEGSERRRCQVAAPAIAAFGVVIVGMIAVLASSPASDPVGIASIDATTAPRSRSGSAVSVRSNIAPAIDGGGRAWFVEERGGDSGDAVTTLTVMGAQGAQDSAELHLGRRSHDLRLLPRDDGVVLAGWVCLDQRCESGAAQVTAVRFDGERIVADEPWVSDEAVGASFAAPHPAGRTSVGIAIMFDTFVVMVPETGSPKTIAVPESLGDPCLTESGALVAVGVDVDPDAPTSDEVRPDQEPVDRPVVVEEHTEHGWVPVEGDEPSWARMYVV